MPLLLYILFIVKRKGKQKICSYYYYYKEGEREVKRV
jgi:hypothetical protein